MTSPPTSPQEEFQDGLSGVSSPKTSADQSKMNEVNRSLFTADNSPVLIRSDEVSGSKKPNDPNQEGQRDQVYTSLRAIVNKVATELRKSSDEVLDPDPISYCLPENYGGTNAFNIKASSSPSSSAETKTRAKSTLVGEETVSFVLLPDCQIGIDSTKNFQHQSSFEERLRGWHIECRRRANGKLDLFYRHGQLSRMFRSTIEVVEYIMEAFTAKETSGDHDIQEQGPASATKGLSKRIISSNEKEEIPPSKIFKISNVEKFPNAQSESSRSVDNTSVEKANQETDVKAFLEESYNNLKNNFCSGSGAQESDHGWETSLKSSSENKDDASSYKETHNRRMSPIHGRSL